MVLLGVVAGGRTAPASSGNRATTAAVTPLLPPWLYHILVGRDAGRRDPTRPGLWVREHLARTGARMPVDRLGAALAATGAEIFPSGEVQLR